MFDRLQKPLRALYALFVLIASCGALASMAACAAAPQRIVLPQSLLQLALDQAMPLDYQLPGILKARATQSLLTLEPQRHQARLDVQLTVQSPLLAQWVPDGTLAGTVALTGGLRYDAERRALLLDHPHLDTTGLAAGRLAPPARRVLEQLIDEWLAQQPLYRLRGEQLQIAGIAMVPQAIAVVDGGIEIRMRAP